MEPQTNAVEKTYNRLNTATKLTVSSYEWLMLLGVALAFALPEVTGIPRNYGIPVTLFVFFSAVAYIRRRTGWRKSILVNAFGCFILYLALTFLGLKH